MIRFVLWVMIFCVGLAAAAAWFGQMHHLRRAFPDRLPGWASAIPDDTGLRRGEIALSARGVIPATRLMWVAGAPGLDGLVWDLRLTGPGIDLQAEMVLAYWPDRAMLRAGTGTVILADMTGNAVQGTVALRQLDGVIAGLLATPVVSGTLQAQAQNARVEDTDLGQGPVAGALDAAGNWRLALDLGGGLTPVTGQIKGAGLSGAQLDLTIADVTVLPPAARQMLEAAGSLSGTALRIELPLSLGE